MALTLNPLKMISNLIKAPLSNMEAVLTQPFRMFKDLITGHPIEALKEPFKTIGTEFKNLGTVLTMGVYSPDADPKTNAP